jgi:hypothetical protein
VKGTYFRVEADLEGKAVTRVLEGSVRLANGPFADTLLYAGQYLQFDPSVQQYRIFTGGPVLLKDDLYQLPMVEELLRYNAVTVRASVPEAHVHVDGRYCGTTPITLRQPNGRHRIRISKNGYISADTILSIPESGGGILFTAVLEKEGHRRRRTVRRSETVRRNVQKNGLKTGKKSISATSENIKSSSAASAMPDVYIEAQRAERHGNWRKAVKLYEKVVKDPAVTQLRHEDALFSIGKLQAEHVKNVEVAKETFLTYLALFPSGTFAGETWLRLAELEFKKNPEAAIQYYLKYFKLFPRHPRIAELQDRVGVIYLQQKQYDKAIEMFEKALANLTSPKGSDRRHIAAHLHNALTAIGDQQRAESVRRRYLSTAINQ